MKSIVIAKSKIYCNSYIKKYLNLRWAN